MYREIINQFSFSQRIIIVFMFFLSITYLAAFLSTFYIKHDIDNKHRKWADSYIGPLSWGLLFLIAFTISNTWNFLSSALFTIDQEVSSLRLIYLYANMFPPEVKQGIISHEKNYIDSLKGEWKTLNKGYESDISRQKIQDFYIYLSHIDLKTENEKLYYLKILKYIDEVMILRRNRIEKAYGLMPKQLIQLILTLSMVLCFSLGAIRGEVKLSGMWSLILFSFSISLFITLILDFNYPFSGDISPKVDRYNLVFETYKHIKESFEAYH